MSLAGAISGDAEVARAAMACRDAVERLDPVRFRACLEEAAVSLGRVRLLDELVAPLLRDLGDATCGGRLRIGHEHLATAVLGPFLDGLHGAV